MILLQNLLPRGHAAATDESLKYATRPLSGNITKLSGSADGIGLF
ncbi:hypothetical protein [Chitinophaga varians]|nr:hypothetical protein [Chitinophaga varians]